MLEILLFFRGIIRLVCKAGVLLFGLCLFMTEPDFGNGMFALIMLIVNILILIYYDRMLFHLAEKQGVTIYLEK